MIKAAREMRKSAEAGAERALRIARDVLAIEADAVQGLVGRIDGRFADAVRLIQGSGGRHVPQSGRQLPAVRGNVRRRSGLLLTLVYRRCVFGRALHD